MASNAGNSCNSPEPEEISFSVPIIARLIVHITSHGKKKTTKKDTKTKEFSHTFSATKSNYLEFLTTVLTKHHIGNKLEVTHRRRYTCKMQVPPSA
jgi:ribosomal protein S7